MIKGLHHNAYRCRDSEETRAFYEDFLGLPLVNALDIGETKTGRETQMLHTFYRLDDGSCLAFFETDDMPFEFKRSTTSTCTSRSKSPPSAAADAGQGRERASRPADLGPRDDRLDLLPRSERLRDRAVRQARRARRLMDPAINGARGELQRWMARKAKTPALRLDARRRPSGDGHRWCPAPWSLPPPNPPGRQTPAVEPSERWGAGGGRPRPPRNADEAGSLLNGFRGAQKLVASDCMYRTIAPNSIRLVFMRHHCESIEREVQ